MHKKNYPTANVTETPKIKLPLWLNIDKNINQQILITTKSILQKKGYDIINQNEAMDLYKNLQSETTNNLLLQSKLTESDIKSEFENKLKPVCNILALKFFYNLNNNSIVCDSIQYRKGQFPQSKYVKINNLTYNKKLNTTLEDYLNNFFNEIKY